MGAARRVRSSFMNPVDRELLRRIQSNARLSLSALAKELGVSRSGIARRLQELEQEGVIMGYRSIVNPASLGFEIAAFVAVSVRRGVIRPSPQLELAKRVLNEADGRDLPFVEEAHIITGQYDLLFKVLARNMRQMSRFLVEYLGTMDEVQRTETMIVLNTVADWRVRPLPVA